MDEVFIDASFWVAIMFAADQHHHEAQTLWEPILSRDRRTVTTNWTLYEALTVLTRRRVRRHDLALRLMEIAQRTTQVVDASELEDQALDIFTSHFNSSWSVVDCANFACIDQRESMWALSFDRDFAQAQSEFGFTLLGVELRA